MRNRGPTPIEGRQTSGRNRLHRGRTSAGRPSVPTTDISAWLASGEVAQDRDSWVRDPQLQPRPQNHPLKAPGKSRSTQNHPAAWRLHLSAPRTTAPLLIPSTRGERWAQGTPSSQSSHGTIALPTEIHTEDGAAPSCTADPFGQHMGRHYIAFTSSPAPSDRNTRPFW
jgi:hypothetical protein